MGDTTEPGALLAIATDLALAAGALLAERLRTVRETVETKSSLTDMVTDVDRDSEALIAGRLRATRPDDAILGEEGGARAGSSSVRWIVDPLDGTTNYLYAFPSFAVSVAAEVDGEVVAGAVHDAAHGQTFTASLGGGAFVDGRPIAVSGKADLATALVGTGFAYDAGRRAEQARALLTILPRVRDIRRAGAASLDLCWVACGRLDAYYERGLMPWDLAAGDLIVREAGGRTGGLHGGVAEPGSLAAASAGLLEPLQALLREAGA